MTSCPHSSVLCRAVELQDAESVEILLALRGNALTPVSRGTGTTTALHRSAEVGNSKFVERCIEVYRKDERAKGLVPIDIDLPCNGITPLLR